MLSNIKIKIGQCISTFFPKQTKFEFKANGVEYSINCKPIRGIASDRFLNNSGNMSTYPIALSVPHQVH